MSTIIFTAINVPYSALNALMTQDPYERSVLSVFRNLLATAGTLTINLTTLPLVEYFGDNASAWTKTFCVLGLLAVAAFLINFFGTKERVKPAGAENGEIRNVPFMVGIKALFQNKYWIMVTMMLVFDFLMYSINSGATVYYAKDVLGNKNFVGTINGISNTVQIAGMFFISGGELSLIIASSVLKGLGYSCGGATMWAMVSDTIDYGEWKTGVRTEGLVNSACSFGYKIGNGVGSVLLGVILEMGGYVGEAVSQTASALTSIRICFIWIPVAAYIAQLIIMKFYNLDKEFNGVIEELKKRNHTEEA